MNIIKRPSPNFGSRSENPIKYIVLHIMAGTLAGTDSWFSKVESQVSAHYGIGYNGEIHQYVDDQNEAWANGVVKSPTAQIVKDNLGVNQNKISLSIESEGYDLNKAPEAQIGALMELIGTLAVKYSIPIDRNHIIGHYQIDSVDRPNCPSVDKSVIDIIVEKVANSNLNKKNMTKTKWVKFYTTDSNEVVTFSLATYERESVGETHQFVDAADAVARSTGEVFIFWDNEPVGPGSVAE